MTSASQPKALQASQTPPPLTTNNFEGTNLRFGSDITFAIGCFQQYFEGADKGSITESRPSADQESRRFSIRAFAQETRNTYGMASSWPFGKATLDKVLNANPAFTLPPMTLPPPLTLSLDPEEFHGTDPIPQNGGNSALPPTRKGVRGSGRFSKKDTGFSSGFGAPPPVCPVCRSFRSLSIQVLNAHTNRCLDKALSNDRRSKGGLAKNRNLQKKAKASASKKLPGTSSPPPVLLLPSTPCIVEAPIEFESSIGKVRGGRSGGRGRRKRTLPGEGRTSRYRCSKKQCPLPQTMSISSSGEEEEDEQEEDEEDKEREQEAVTETVVVGMERMGRHGFASINAVAPAFASASASILACPSVPDSALAAGPAPAPAPTPASVPDSAPDSAPAPASAPDSAPDSAPSSLVKDERGRGRGRDKGGRGKGSVRWVLKGNRREALLAREERRKRRKREEVIVRRRGRSRGKVPEVELGDVERRARRKQKKLTNESEDGGGLKEAKYGEDGMQEKGEMDKTGGKEIVGVKRKKWRGKIGETVSKDPAELCRNEEDETAIAVAEEENEDEGSGREEGRGDGGEIRVKAVRSKSIKYKTMSDVYRRAKRKAFDPKSGVRKAGLQLDKNNIPIRARGSFLEEQQEEELVESSEEEDESEQENGGKEEQEEEEQGKDGQMEKVEEEVEKGRVVEGRGRDGGGRGRERGRKLSAKGHGRVQRRIGGLRNAFLGRVGLRVSMARKRVLRSGKVGEVRRRR